MNINASNAKVQCGKIYQLDSSQHPIQFQDNAAEFLKLSLYKYLTAELETTELQIQTDVMH